MALFLAALGVPALCVGIFLILCELAPEEEGQEYEPFFAEDEQ